jgi:hypothetical protein
MKLNVYVLWQQRTGNDPAVIALGRSANMAPSLTITCGSDRV